MWDERYQTEEYVYGKKPNDFLRQASSSLTQGKVLCLAEGEGRNAIFLAQHGHQVTAVDISSVGLEKAQLLAKESNVQITTEVADLSSYHIEPENWDTIVSIFCHVPPQVRKALHKKVVSGLRPGGKLILEAYTPAQLDLGTGGPPHKELMMTLTELRRELSGLKFDHAQETERIIIEGCFHRGKGAVVQVTARKAGDSKKPS